MRAQEEITKPFASAVSVLAATLSRSGAAEEPNVRDAFKLTATKRRPTSAAPALDMARK